MAELAGSVGARFAVVSFPYASQIYGEDSGRLQEQLVELGREGGWPTLDLGPVFRRASEQSAPPLMFDAWHPSAAGHDVAAAAIDAWLEREQLLSR
jgi:hypothetical protein